ncbi:unnamed protein product [Didymodactylos carnosus]|uniref:Uncharacterized protein n=1 Tax=Didymodactylos carnosus TaxID=1234261 RepID=A0A8S2L6M4_9BILA|nr:unnamed protein product [Didymodactylos carnosus]CAF3876677.1 unnamed protein product [Didymodactylos carnosus]
MSQAPRGRGRLLGRSSGQNNGPSNQLYRRAQSAAVGGKKIIQEENGTQPSIIPKIGEKRYSPSRSSVTRPKSCRPIEARSPVPDSKIYTLVLRPDSGGSAGRKVDFHTNHFKCAIPKELIVKQYDVDVVIQNRDGTWRPAKKDDRFLVMKKIIEREKFPFVWYDDGKNLYSTEDLSGFQKQYEMKVKHKNTDNEKIWDFFDPTKNISIRPRDSVRVLETLLKQHTRSTMVCDGRGIGYGFYQAMFLTKVGVTLNINNTFTCFYHSMNLVDFLCDYLQTDITRGIPEREQQLLLKKVLKSIWLETNHTGQVRKYRIRGFGLSSNRHTFPKQVENDQGNEDGDRTSVTEYFREKYDRKLRYPDLPTVELYTPGNKSLSHHLPMEVCTIQEWQRSIKPLTADQRARVTKKTVVKPEQRYDTIMRVVYDRKFNDDTYLKQIGMTVEDKDMIIIPGRILPPPEIWYKSNRDNSDVIERVSIGKWNLRNRLHTTREIKKWACVLVSSREPSNREIDVASQFAARFPEIIGRFGIYFSSAPIQKSDPAVPNIILRRLEELKQEKCEVVLFILNGVGEDIYKCIKYFGNQKLGIITQCTDYSAIQKNIMKLDMYLQNLVQKFNAKLGGVNGLISLTRALTSASKKDDVFMFFGADVTHTTCSRDRPSIACVVGSRDSTSTQYASRMTEQYPPKGRISLEIIMDLFNMSTDLLKLFASSNGCLPNKIVFYRDGVDDGSYQKVMDNEIRALKNACKALYLDNPQPKITFLVVKKRHNTRFFVYDQHQNTTSNVQAGTVVDTHIVHPSLFDFYLNSHAAIMGTSHPVLYHVLYDEIGFTSDEIQQLTYYLCHADVRCTKAVSIPAPAHYAHLAAYHSRDLDYQGDRRSSINGYDDDIIDSNITLEEVQTKVIQLDPSIQDTMWYV